MSFPKPGKISPHSSKEGESSYYTAVQMADGCEEDGIPSTAKVGNSTSDAMATTPASV